MSEIYWITRLDGIYTCFGTMMIVSLVILLSMLFSGYITDELKKYLKYMRWLSISFIIGMLGIVFTPKTNDMLMIYGLGTVKEYIESNDKVKELPDKTIEVITNYLDKLNENDL